MTIQESTKQAEPECESKPEYQPVHHCFKRLLVAVDYSDQSDYAADIAASMAAQQHAEIVLTHVCHLPQASEAQSICMEPDLVSVCMDAAEALLATVKQKMPANLHIETDLRQGDPADEILKSANSHHSDLIVMGTRSRGRFAQAVAGSVARIVAHGAGCPVLTLTLPVSKGPSERECWREVAGAVIQ
jgi:nucleotide-binding universal stress UspA family protein